MGVSTVPSNTRESFVLSFLNRAEDFFRAEGLLELLASVTSASHGMKSKNDYLSLWGGGGPQSSVLLVSVLPSSTRLGRSFLENRRARVRSNE